MSDNLQQLRVQRYQPADKARWDAFVGDAKNSTFLFRRDYMDYHQERFVDHSLMILEGAEIVALLPANIDRHGVLVSHQGLTYGGLVIAKSASVPPLTVDVTVPELTAGPTDTGLFVQVRVPV